MNQRGLFLILTILTPPNALLSQGLTTASINEKVTDTNNNPLAGANVVATHSPSGTTFGTFSRSDGRFNHRHHNLIPLLRSMLKNSIPDDQLVQLWV